MDGQSEGLAPGGALLVGRPSPGEVGRDQADTVITVVLRST